MDLDADGRIDLVSTAEYRDGYPYAWGIDSGDPSWRMYRNVP